MSKSDLHNTQAAKSTSSSGLNNSSTDIKAKIDARLDELIKNVLPYTPYILRLQQPHGKLSQPLLYHHWSIGTPLFSQEERELQYLTFRQSPEGMLHSQGNWDDGKGAFPALKKAPNQEAAKKKISFAFVNRDKSKSVGKDAAPSLEQPKPEAADLDEKGQTEPENNENSKKHEDVEKGAESQSANTIRSQEEGKKSAKRYHFREEFLAKTNVLQICSCARRA